MKYTGNLLFFLASTHTFEDDSDESEDLKEPAIVNAVTEAKEELDAKLILDIQNLCKKPVLDKRMYY